MKYRYGYSRSIYPSSLDGTKTRHLFRKLPLEADMPFTCGVVDLSDFWYVQDRSRTIH